MPRFSLQVTQPVKKEERWEVTALATVLYGSRPPDPPQEVIFDVNGEEFERVETNANSGIARSVMILQSGGYIVTAYLSRSRDIRQYQRFVVKEEKKERKLTPDEEKAVTLEAKTARLKAEKKLKEAEQELKQVGPPKPKSQIKILHIYRRLSRLEVILQRIRKDGRPEDGEISVLDFEQGGIVFGDAPDDFPFRKKEWGMVVVFLPYFDYPRQVTFFLPDDPDAKAFVDVPARTVKEEKKSEATPKSSLWAMMKEAYREERNEGKAPTFELKIQRRRPLIFLTPQGGQDGR